MNRIPTLERTGWPLRGPVHARTGMGLLWIFMI